jgi:hypothetical protein
VWHLGRQGFRQAQQAGAAGRGFVPGEGDLRGDVLAPLCCGDSKVGLGAALGGIEGHSDPGLHSRDGRFQLLQPAQLVDQPGTVSGQTQRPDPGKQVFHGQAGAGDSFGTGTWDRGS